MMDFLEGLPEGVREAVQPLFDVLSPEAAMEDLLPSTPRAEIQSVVAEAVEKLRPWPPLIAAIWLYADDLELSHRASQEIFSLEGSYWHGIMHRREGDFSNSKYWFRQAGSLPSRLGLDPFALTDEVARHHRENPAHLVEAQRREWQTLFEHCARQIV